MQGWIIPPPSSPTKRKQDLVKERAAKVEWLIKKGLLKSERIKQALLKVPREDFIPTQYRDYAYEEVPLPLPGRNATISCPHSYPLFYEPLGLDKGHRFLEIGLGSGYGTAIAREVVGQEGLVVAMEIDPLTFAFAENNLKQAGYTDVILVNDDGGLGFSEQQPYDRIAITAACPEIPPPLIEQLAIGGRLIAPLIEHGIQNLVLLTKASTGRERRALCQVLYVNLRGAYGVEQDSAI
jgi:protein-L-isoaspartate(D-aspartate) O-methyltransferase